MFSRSHLRVAGVLVSLAALSSATAAAAASFDPSGMLVLDSHAAWTLGFEPGDPGLPPAGPVDAGAADGGDAGAEGGTEAGAPDAGPPLDIEKDGDAIEGKHLLRVAQYQGINIPVTLPADSHSYHVSLWARGEVIATVEAGYEKGRIDQFGQLFPTGRMTSDGWYELATDAFSFDASRAKVVQVGLFSPAAAGADVDAIEISVSGPPVAERSCAGVGDPLACGPDQECQWGLCRDMTAQVPPLPPVDYRDQLVSYLDARFHYLFGPFENRRRDLPNARAEIDAMRSATDAWSFWKHFKVAVHRLHDWHTQESDLAGYVIDSPKPIAVCFVEGKADASQSQAPSTPGYMDVLVSHVGDVNTFGLHTGDRLVSVDGQHPIEWARSLIGVDDGFWTASNHTTHAEDASRLRSLIARYADHIQVLRCDSSTGSCASKPETISISDLPPSPPGTSTGISCDNRPFAHVPGAPDNHSTHGTYSGLVTESNPTEAIYGLSWSSLYVTGTGQQGDVGPDLDAAISLWRQKARGVILDHRTGFGGTSLGPQKIWEFVRKPTPLDIFVFRDASAEQGPKDTSEGLALFNKLAKVGGTEYAGGPNPALDVPVALLTTLDGSASDWLPLGVKGAPEARIFAPYETAGGFSTRFQFAYWMGLGYSIAVGDTVSAQGQMLNGHGVEPDVQVAPLQSDLLAGRDTVYDAALAWVRSELKP